MKERFSGRKSRWLSGRTGRALLAAGAALLIAGAGLAAPGAAVANPYLAKPGQRADHIRVATCATSGGFIHLYTALDYGLFKKYGIDASFLMIHGASVSLPALANNEIQFLYCAAAATVPGMASGIDATLIGVPLVGLPYVLVARKGINSVQDLKGHSIGVSHIGSLDWHLSRLLLEHFHLTGKEVTIRPIGGSQHARFEATLQGVVQAIPITPPLDVLARRDGLNVLYHLNEMHIPFIYSALHTNFKMLEEHPNLVQRFTAAMAESIHFVQMNPDKAMAALSKAMRIKDKASLESAYNAYAKKFINRSMVVPKAAVVNLVNFAREQGTKIRRRATSVYTNKFVDNLQTSGFMKELWGRPIGGKK